MAFRLADVKKTVRARSDGERYLHPKLLDPATVAAQVSLALSYFHSRLGRARHDVDGETLVRFFGDPKVARGLVACLHTCYRWRNEEFADVLDVRAVARLARKGIHTPSELRLHLYDRINKDGRGYLPSERDENLAPLARSLGLAPALLDRLAALDAEENAVLAQTGAVPAPEHIVSLYNHYVVDALLRNSVYVQLEGVKPAARAALTYACDDYGVALSWDGDTARLDNAADAFGSYARAGVRLTRALYSAAAVAPELLSAGRALVHTPGKKAYYLLERATLRALTGGCGQIHRADAWETLRPEWDRYRATEGTDGWRLLGAPEPAVSAAGLAVAPFACRRDETLVLLWPARSEATLREALALRNAGLAVLPLVDSGAAENRADWHPYASIDDGVAGIIAALNAHWGGARVAAGEQVLSGLLDEVAVRGFLPERYVVDALGVTSLEEARPRLRALDPARGSYVAGIGLCSPAFMDGMRKGLRRARRRKPAA